jgi:hypothetical protein
MKDDHCECSKVHTQHMHNHSSFTLTIIVYIIFFFSQHYIHCQSPYNITSIETTVTLQSTSSCKARVTETITIVIGDTPISTFMRQLYDSYSYESLKTTSILDPLISSNVQQIQFQDPVLI